MGGIHIGLDLEDETTDLGIAGSDLGRLAGPYGRNGPGRRGIGAQAFQQLVDPEPPQGGTEENRGHVSFQEGLDFEGRRGTLHLEISIEEHPTFRREGDADLVVEHRVSLKDALCGFTFDLVHLNGRSYKFNCKPCSITGSMNETKILPGLGYNESGALKIRFSIGLPTSLTEEQIAAISSIL